MAQNSHIEWTGATWNPWRGCHKVSPGCDNCYMFREQRRYGREPDVVLRSTTTFNDPLRWVRRGNPPRLCFTCSWSDWFIAEADPWRDEAWDIIRRTPQIAYQILTKRAGRILPHLPPDWGDGWPNVWLGVSVEAPDQRQRISTLRSIPAAIRFVSFEPLLGDVVGRGIDLSGIDWVIVGGESGPDCRPMLDGWAESIRVAARMQAVAFFMKQMGGKFDKRGELEDLPESLRVREYPTGDLPTEEVDQAVHAEEFPC